MCNVQTKLNEVEAILENTKLGYSSYIINDACNILIEILNNMDIDELDCLDTYLGLQSIEFMDITDAPYLVYTKIDYKLVKQAYTLHIQPQNPSKNSIIIYLNKIKKLSGLFSIEQTLVITSNLYELIEILKWIDMTKIRNLSKLHLEIRDYYNEKFYSKNYSILDINYCDSIYKNMITINKVLQYDLDLELIFMIAYIHDLYNRPMTKINKYVLVIEHIMDVYDKYIGLFENHERKIISNAIRECESDTLCDRSSKYSIVFKIAHTEKPILSEIIKRNYTYYKQVNSDNIALANIVNYIKTKYSKSGNMYKCDFYIEYYGSKLIDFWEDVENLTFEQVDKILFKG